MASDPDTAALRREFEDFRQEQRDARKEEREARKALEQKLWGLVAAMFVIVVGYLFAQIQNAGAAPAAASPGAAVIFVWKLLGG